MYLLCKGKNDTDIILNIISRPILYDVSLKSHLCSYLSYLWEFAKGNFSVVSRNQPAALIIENEVNFLCWRL